MKNLKHLFVISLIFFSSAVFVLKVQPGHLIWWFIMTIIPAFFIFNLLFRKSLSFKPYFTSRYNLLTTKRNSEQSYGIPKELLFEKIKEVIRDSDFKLIEADKDKFEILATSKMTFKSWGENLYLSFVESGKETTMQCCSTTFFQMYDWGKNEKNCAEFLDTIDASLTV